MPNCMQGKCVLLKRGLHASFCCLVLNPLIPSSVSPQASRAVVVGFCDGNHGPQQPLCLQRSRQRGRRHKRPRGTHFSRAGHHRNRPQSVGGHIRLHLHLGHIRFSARTSTEDVDPSLDFLLTATFLFKYLDRVCRASSETRGSSALRPAGWKPYLSTPNSSVLLAEDCCQSKKRSCRQNPLHFPPISKRHVLIFLDTSSCKKTVNRYVSVFPKLGGEKVCSILWSFFTVYCAALSQNL